MTTSFPTATAPRSTLRGALLGTAVLAALAASPALAQDAATTTAPKVTIATIAAVNSSIDEVTLRGILNGEIVPNSREVAALDADSISIPTIVIESPTMAPNGEPATSVTIFRNVELVGILNGVASSLTIDSVSAEGPEMTAELGSISTGTFGVTALLAFFGVIDADDPELFDTIYRDLAVGGGTLVSDGITCNIGAYQSGELYARPLRTSYADVVAAASEGNNPNPTPEQVTAMLEVYADVFSAFESGLSSSLQGLTCGGTGSEGNPLSVSVGQVNIGGMVRGTYPGFEMLDLAIEVTGGEDAGRVAFDDIIAGPIDFTAAIAFFEAAEKPVDQAWMQQNWRQLLPAPEGFRFGGVEVDVPSASGDAERTIFSVEDFQVRLLNYLNGLPTVAILGAEGLVVTLPDLGPDELVGLLRAAGFKTLSLEFWLVTAWDETTEQIAIDEWYFRGADLGSVLLTGIFGNATAALFDPDPLAMVAAFEALTVLEAHLQVEDRGLKDFVIAVVAGQQGADPLTFKAQLAAIAKATLMQMMGASDEVMALSQAIGVFLGDGTKLTVDAVATDPAGIGLADFAGPEANPAAILDKMEVTATAE